jgi:hypothetical protein
MLHVLVLLFIIVRSPIIAVVSVGLCFHPSFCLRAVYIGPEVRTLVAGGLRGNWTCTDTTSMGTILNQ